MKTMLPVRDVAASHRGFRSPGYQVLGSYGPKVPPELLGVRRRHAQAMTLALKCARRAPFREIVIQ